MGLFFWQLDGGQKKWLRWYIFLCYFQISTPKVGVFVYHYRYAWCYLIRAMKISKLAGREYIRRVFYTLRAITFRDYYDREEKEKRGVRKGKVPSVFAWCGCRKKCWSTKSELAPQASLSVSGDTCLLISFSFTAYMSWCDDESKSSVGCCKRNSDRIRERALQEVVLCVVTPWRNFVESISEITRESS